MKDQHELNDGALEQVAGGRDPCGIDVQPGSGFDFDFVSPLPKEPNTMTPEQAKKERSEKLSLPPERDGPICPYI